MKKFLLILAFLGIGAISNAQIGPSNSRFVQAPSKMMNSVRRIVPSSGGGGGATWVIGERCLVEFANADTNYTKNTTGNPALWNDPMSGLNASQSVHANKPTLIKKSLRGGGGLSMAFNIVATAPYTVLARFNVNTINAGNTNGLFGTQYSGDGYWDLAWKVTDTHDLYLDGYSNGTWAGITPSNAFTDAATHSIAVVVTPSGLTGYVDGASKGSCNGSYEPRGTSWVFLTGEASNPTVMTISYFAILPRALTAGEVGTASTSLSSKYP